MKKILFVLSVTALSLNLFAQKWYLSEKITSSDIEKGDGFGYSVSICDSFLIVGAPWEDDIYSGGSILENIGASYLYKLDENGNWNEIQKIRPDSLLKDRDKFGGLVSISSKFALIAGEWNHYIYFFELKNDTLCIMNEIREDQYSGWYVSSISISDKYAIIGAGGNAYIYELNDSGVWKEKIDIDVEGFDSGSRISVDLDNDYAIIGSQSTSEGIDNTFLQAGAAFIYKRNPNGVWENIQKLVASDRGAYDNFGYSVRILGDEIFIGANADGHDENGENEINDAGSVYYFKYEETSGKWVEKQKITADSRHEWDRYGTSLDYKDSKLIIGGQQRAPLYFEKNDSKVFYEKQLINPTMSIWRDVKAICINSNNIIIGTSDDTYGDNSGMIFSFVQCPEIIFTISGKDTVVLDQTEVYTVPDSSNLTYSWNVQTGTIIDSLSNYEYSIKWNNLGTGYIYVIATNQHGCTSDTAKLEVYVGSSDVRDIVNNKNIKIYPNPANENLVVLCNEDFVMEIYDLSGRKLIVSEKKETDISVLSEGMYIVLIKDREGIIKKLGKLIVE